MVLFPISFPMQNKLILRKQARNVINSLQTHQQRGGRSSSWKAANQGQICGCTKKVTRCVSVYRDFTFFDPFEEISFFMVGHPQGLSFLISQILFSFIFILLSFQLPPIKEIKVSRKIVALLYCIFVCVYERRLAAYTAGGYGTM